MPTKSGVALWQLLGYERFSIPSGSNFGNECDYPSYVARILPGVAVYVNDFTTADWGAGWAPMARKIRIEYAGADYHVMARGTVIRVGTFAPMTP